MNHVTKPDDMHALAVIGAIATLERMHSREAAQAVVQVLRSAYVKDSIADRVWELLGHTEPRFLKGAK